MNLIPREAAQRRTEIRLARAIRALLQKGTPPKEVAELLDLKESDLLQWVKFADFPMQ